MKKIIFALICAFAASVASAEMTAQEKIYYDTITWPIMKKLDACSNVSYVQRLFSGDAAKCYAKNVDFGLRYQSLSEYKAEAREMARVSANLATGKWKIKTATTPEEFPHWATRCGHVIIGNDWITVQQLDAQGLPVVDANGSPIMVKQRAPGRPVATFEECWAAVEKWSPSARQTYAQYFTKSWIKMDNGEAYDLQRAPALPDAPRPLLGRYAFQPNWAKQLGFVGPTFAQQMWQSAMPTITSKLAAVPK